MANKQDRFYFENFVSAGEQACRAAKFLKECLSDFKPEELGTRLAEMHEIEHAGDVKKHELSAALAKAFVTPVDREDLALVSHSIDEVTDSLEEIMQNIYVDRIKTVLPEAIVFAEKLVECCELTVKILTEFQNFKKPAKLREMIIELNHAEEECDKLYLEAVRSVPEHCTDVLEIVFWREIYACMESSADACEDVGDSIETVVMKNT